MDFVISFSMEEEKLQISCSDTFDTSTFLYFCLCISQENGFGWVDIANQLLQDKQTSTNFKLDKSIKQKTVKQKQSKNKHIQSLARKHKTQIRQLFLAECNRSIKKQTNKLTKTTKNKLKQLYQAESLDYSPRTFIKWTNRCNFIRIWLHETQFQLSFQLSLNTNLLFFTAKRVFSLGGVASQGRSKTSGRLTAAGKNRFNSSDITGFRIFIYLFIYFETNSSD